MARMHSLPRIASRVSRVLILLLYPWNYDQRGFEQTEDIFRASIWSVGVNYLSLPAGLAPIGLIEGCRRACRSSASATART